MHLVGFIIIIYHDARSPERQFITMHGHLIVSLSRWTVNWTSNSNEVTFWMLASGDYMFRAEELFETRRTKFCTPLNHIAVTYRSLHFFCGHSFISFQQQFMTCTCTRLSQINVAAPCNLYYGPTFWKPPLPTHGTKTAWVGDLMLTSRVFFILSTSHIFSPNRCPLTSQNAWGPVRNSELLESEIIQRFCLSMFILTHS